MEPSRRRLELWAGVECTCNRTGDRWSDQLERTGHAHRLGDLDLIASLGLRALRYPVLWERTVREPGAPPDWSWSDARLERLREARIEPILGLLHHGPGPFPGGMLDPSFSERFAEYALAVATRYPWVTDYLPINEPLTTARFSALYGVWHPHAQDIPTFARMLIAQLKASVLAIEAVRSVAPGARFIQNEDLGKTFAVPRLRYQAAFENERRWVVFDLLCGRLRPGMPMWDHLARAGIDEAELAWFADRRTRPDVLAVDHYATSDRLLDDRLERYPRWAHGGNRTDVYADIEAVRVVPAEQPGFLRELREAWARYGLPLVLGEVHLGCTREEQMRWLRDAWDAAERARAEGIDVGAVTVWSVFGAYDWNTLVTQDNGFYEPGVYDVRDGTPRETALAPMMRALSERGTYDHPVLEGDGWWRRPERFTYPVVGDETVAPVTLRPVRTPGRTLALAGDDRHLRAALERICHVRGLPVEGASDARDLCEAWAVVVGIECADAVPGERAATTVEGLASIARACARRKIPMLVLSCEHADDPTWHGFGERTSERCGRRARALERAAQAASHRVLIVRSGYLFGPWAADDALIAALATNAEGGGAGAARSPRPLRDARATVRPAYIPDVVNVSLDLLLDGETGIRRADHGSQVTWDDLVALARAASGMSERPLHVIAPARTEPTLPLPPLRDALARFARESMPLWDPEGCAEPKPEEEAESGPAFLFPASEPSSTLSRPDDDTAMAT